MIHIQYVKKDIAVDIKKENLLGVFEPNAVDEPSDISEAIRNALFAPYGGPDFNGFLEGAKTVLLVINDATRPTPSGTIIATLLPLLERYGITEKSGLGILIATGAHRGATDEEFGQLFGSLAARLKNCCISHDSQDVDELVNLGVTRNGTPIILNKRLFLFDRIIIIGSVEPHYFAGFTGGRKAFLPGVAGYETIVANHRLALSEKAQSLALEGNPVHEDMMDALRHISAPVFSIMSVLDKEQGIAAVTAGDITDSFHAAVDVAKKVFCVKIPRKADIVISVAKFPMDINLYQSQKAIDNGAHAVKDGGILILVSACREGIGGKTFADLLARSSSPEDALERISREYKLGYHKAAKMAAIMQRMTVFAVTNLDAGLQESLFLTPVGTVQEAITKAIGVMHDKGIDTPQVIVFPDGCVTIPVEE
ncbi:nickel-dependent lactate racemase [Parasphaerochaeta coccoides]|nr:nickel-dependent lactate racemase [Parasphaerochaeta coccoides]